MNKKIEVKISNKLLYSIIVLAVIILVVSGIYAYNPSGSANPAVMGHSLNEFAPPIGCSVGQYLQRVPTTLGWNCATPSAGGGVSPPTSACNGANQGLQWTGSAWSCKTFTSSGSSGVSVSCNWVGWEAACVAEYRQYDLHATPSTCSNDPSKYLTTSYYCSGGYITDSKSVVCCPRSFAQ